MTTFHTTTLSNGLRIIQEPCPTENVYCGILIGAGTRHEDPNDSGLAHFCEHVTFKGTERRKACHIRNCLERIGGDLNAYTNKEETTYYATVQSEHFARAVDILTDIVFHSIYPAAELKKETEVIIDEIDSYRDSPAELIYDEFEAMLFRNHPLGRDILGNAERLRTYSTEDALRFTRKNYVPSNATFYVLGCPAEKTMITANGIDVGRFADIPGKKEEDLPYVNIGAVLRVTPIKDVKSMIRAYAFAKKIVPNLKLWIMGPCDEDEKYAQECFELVDVMQLEDVVFTGRINVTDYLGRMDFTILTSISEGQPLTILEGYAAHKPAVATDVGNCRGLIYGEEGDELGAAGVLTHIMNTEEIANAMVELAQNPDKMLKMGEIGYQRMLSKYQLGQMQEKYQEIYINVGDISAKRRKWRKK